MNYEFKVLLEWPIDSPSRPNRCPQADHLSAVLCASGGDEGIASGR